MINIPQSIARSFVLKAYLSSDHITAATSKTIAIVISKNLGAFGNPSAGATNATEIGSGWYYVTLSTTDIGTQGPLIIRGTSSGVDDVETWRYVADAHNQGFDALPSVASAVNGGVPVLDANLEVKASTLRTNNDKTGYALSAAAVQAIWDFLTSAATTVGSMAKLIVTNLDALISSRSTYAGADTSGTTTLLSRLTGTRATNLDNLDAAISTRLASASYTAPPTAVQNRTEMDSNSTKLANLDATISSRSTVTSANVLTQVDAAMDAVSSELASIPGNTASFRLQIRALFQYLMFKRTATATTETMYKNDGSTSLGTSTLSDDGTTATHGKVS